MRGWLRSRASDLRDNRDAHAFIALAVGALGETGDDRMFIRFLDQCSRRDLEVLACLLAAWYRDRAADRLCADEGLSLVDALRRVKQRHLDLANEAEQELLEEEQ